MAKVLGKSIKIERLNLKIQHLKRHEVSLQRMVLERKAELFFIKEKAKCKKAQHENKRDERKIERLQGKRAKLEQKRNTYIKKQLMHLKKQGLNEVKGMSAEVAGSMHIIEAYQQQLSNIRQDYQQNQ